MVGRFIGTNDGYEGHIAELQISHSGHVIAVIDGREALTGQIRGDRLFVETFEFIVTRTDEGLEAVVFVMVGELAAVTIEAPLVNRAIANAQARVEAMHFDTRKNLFEYDNVMNEQRKAIYALRKQILEGRYQPEILDDAARKEQSKSLLPPPEKSGPHTVETLARTVTPKITAIVEAHIRAVLEEAVRRGRAVRVCVTDGPVSPT